MNNIETKLVLFTDAIVRDDDALLRALLAHTPLAPADDDNHLTNHFYESRSTTLNKSFLGVVIQGLERAKAVAASCECSDKVYWGANTDPVSMITPRDIIKLMTDKPDEYVWSDVKPPSRCRAVIDDLEQSKKKRARPD
tara:strand:+ start:272 stop:688 length:417 start_codon:yes stop_codon:yes gene_type:complete